MNDFPSRDRNTYLDLGSCTHQSKLLSGQCCDAREDVLELNDGATQYSNAHFLGRKGVTSVGFAISALGDRVTGSWHNE